MSLSTTLGTLITLCVGGYLVLDGKITLGAMVALQSYVAKLYTPAQNIADMAVDYKKYLVNIERIEYILDSEGEAACSGERDNSSFSSLNLKDIEFSYNTKSVLNKINMNIEGCGKIAIVGESGSGKSTLINLMMGYIQPDSGQISYNGKDIDQNNYLMMRKNISLASQDTYLFNTSIFDNIHLGNISAVDEDVEKIIRELEIDQIFQNHKDGINTLVSEMGKNISGGQLQRIAIARALLKDSPIIVLDEATSNVDSQNELQIQNKLDELKKSKLIVITSHRLSTLKDADQIFVIKEGSIVQNGTYEELCFDSGGEFRRLFSSQIAGSVV